MSFCKKMLPCHVRRYGDRFLPWKDSQATCLCTEKIHFAFAAVLASSVSALISDSHPPQELRLQGRLPRRLQLQTCRPSWPHVAAHSAASTLAASCLQEQRSQPWRRPAAAAAQLACKDHALLTKLYFLFYDPIVDWDGSSSARISKGSNTNHPPMPTLGVVKAFIW